MTLLQQGDGGGDFVIPETTEGWLDLLSGVIGGAAKFVVAFVVVYLVGRLVAVPLLKRALKARGFNESIRSLADDVFGILVLFAALAISLALAGFGSFLAAFATLGGALALAVGFAAQDLIGNFVAGIFILKDKPFEVGDWIEQDDVVGRVVDIDLRVTTIKTFDNEKITVPNSELADNPVKNPVAYDKLRQKFVFGIGYEDDIDHAKEVILDEASQQEEILADPAPDVRVTELADSYVGLQTRFWMTNPSRSDFMAVRSDFVQAVKERCDAEGIDMPYPYLKVIGGLDVDMDGELATRELQQSADD
ncbi:mechanosensitive ion channel family protein [Halomarina oriensis]|uniref:Mechanosensitive ion channel n=1 Tax=Halomarina oriensis TaxID=671145 RepID=A0A6B0GHI1_9EURY|nr:mechanosensitive ion channel family protein [Halomarina oriensis]MWG34184.1 mechanosensitive ion channel [Halomarina oriensis]